jgi:hypothetical protein
VKRLVGRHEYKWDDNIKMYVGEIGSTIVNFIEMSVG